MWVAIAVLGGTVDTARAFCGFYVSDAEVELGNDSSLVVLLRDGTRTVMTMRNDYVGPPSDFALVVPLPASITERDVHVIDERVLEDVERFTAPRLVEYWEREPACHSPGTVRSRHAVVPSIRSGTAEVRVETSFAVGEYDFEVLGADDSLGLERYLTDAGYRIPENAAPLLRPYVAQGFRFLVAKVDVARVAFVDGRAELSPIRIAYDSPELQLPLRLGVANSRGVQDVAVVVISRDGRYEVANRPNVLVPTNLEVPPDSVDRFPEVYASILDGAFDRNPGAVITEHAWSITSCDPCTGPTLDVPLLDQLGGDVISGTMLQPTLARDVRFSTVERVGGRGHSRAAVSSYLDDRSVAVGRCWDGYGISEMRLDLEFGETGELARLTTRGPSSPRSECMARALRGGRIVQPPLGIDRSRWRVSLHAAPRYRPSQETGAGFTATRLRLRVKPGGESSDLVFRVAPPVVGGRGMPGADGRLPPTERARGESAFQARYAILHRWEEPAACTDPIHRGWGAPSPRLSSAAFQRAEPDASAWRRWAGDPQQRRSRRRGSTSGIALTRRRKNRPLGRVTSGSCWRRLRSGRRRRAPSTTS